ncbi:ABC transporter substrate-binding protein [Paenibacillus alkalitolerans]|uniref:ABC transporter substrate-binding protein n=1 Tax=Paenibacillus alkalitolerans TaxID=2799335 RepID=UPI0018F2DD1F|nr:ABC transporter substrate-binding protein [Paenibacillus alkalitolerans]
MKNFVKTMISGLASVALLMTAVACGSNTAAPAVESGEKTEGAKTSVEKKLVVVSWGGDYQAAQKKAMFEPFMKDTGVKLAEDSPVNIGKLKAMIDNGNVQWDAVDVLGQDIPKLVAQGLLEPIDYNVVKKDDLLETAAREYAVDIDYYSTVLSYNKDNFKEGNVPANWSDLFDTQKFPGSRALYKSPITTLEIALLADGVDPKQLYPLDVERAFKKLDQIKDQIVWWDQGAQPVQLLADNEVILAAAWNGRIAGAANKGQPLEYSYEQGILDAESWVVPKGAPNKETAMEFINYASQAKPQADLLSEIPYGPTNKKAFEHMDAEYAKSLPTYPENLEKQIMLDIDWWYENFAQVNDQFQEWLLK